MRLLNTREAANLLGIKPGTLKFWRCKGRGPKFIKMSDSARSGVVYDPADLDAWKTERTFANTSAYSSAGRTSSKSHNSPPSRAPA